MSRTVTDALLKIAESMTAPVQTYKGEDDQGYDMHARSVLAHGKAEALTAHKRTGGAAGIRNQAVDYGSKAAASRVTAPAVVQPVGASPSQSVLTAKKIAPAALPINTETGGNRLRFGSSFSSNTPLSADKRSAMRKTAKSPFTLPVGTTSLVTAPPRPSGSPKSLPGGGGAAPPASSLPAPASSQPPPPVPSGPSTGRAFYEALSAAASPAGASGPSGPAVPPAAAPAGPSPPPSPLDAVGPAGEVGPGGATTAPPPAEYTTPGAGPAGELGGGAAPTSPVEAVRSMAGAWDALKGGDIAGAWSQTPDWLRGMLGAGGVGILLMLLMKIFGKRGSASYSREEIGHTRHLLDRMVEREKRALWAESVAHSAMIKAAAHCMAKRYSRTHKVSKKPGRRGQFPKGNRFQGAKTAAALFGQVAAARSSEVAPGALASIEKAAFLDTAAAGAGSISRDPRLSALLGLLGLAGGAGRGGYGGYRAGKGVAADVGAGSGRGMPWGSSSAADDLKSELAAKNASAQRCGAIDFGKSRSSRGCVG